MSKSVASESNNGNTTKGASGKRGARDEGDENEDEIIEGSAAANLTTSTTIFTVPATTDQFMHTPEFRRHFVDFVPVDALMALRLATKGWNAAVDALIDEGVASGAMLVHDGKDISFNAAEARKERRELVMRVIFHLDITKVGELACWMAVNLVVVDIPEGVKSIGEGAFYGCRSLTTVSFPTTLTFIGGGSFADCRSLENVDLIRTNLQELGTNAFACCYELKSMTIPNSLQTFGNGIFFGCPKLVPSNIRTNDNDTVVAHLRSKQSNL